jgi:CheY-like chemotaxis protein
MANPAFALHLPVMHPDLDTPARTATVMLVDDMRVNRLIGAQRLRTLQIEVLEAEHGAQALEMLRDRPVDLVLMDCDMPVTDGYAATRTLRQREQRLGLERQPIVALSASSRPEDLLRARAAGMDAHVSKPCTRAQLGETLDRWLRAG